MEVRPSVPPSKGRYSISISYDSSTLRGPAAAWYGVEGEPIQ